MTRPPETAVRSPLFPEDGTAQLRYAAAGVIIDQSSSN